MKCITNSAFIELDNTLIREVSNETIEQDLDMGTKTPLTIKPNEFYWEYMINQEVVDFIITNAMQNGTNFIYSIKGIPWCKRIIKALKLEEYKIICIDFPSTIISNNGGLTLAARNINFKPKKDVWVDIASHVAYRPDLPQDEWLGD